jgi:amino acid permease
MFKSNVVDFGLAMGLIFVGLDLHSMVPGISHSMRKPAEFKKVSAFAYFTAWSLYMALGFTGYYMFGDEVHSEISQSLASQTGFDPVLTQITLLLIAVNPMTKFAMVLAPISSQIEIALKLKNYVYFSRTILATMAVCMSILLPSFSKVAQSNYRWSVSWEVAFRSLWL